MKRPNNKFLLIQYLLGYVVMAYFLYKFGFPLPLIFGLVAVSLSLAGGSMYLSKHYSRRNLLLMLLVILIGTGLLFLMFRNFY
ncbi:hypothetical protein SIN07_08855 [Pediococcus inopinatus]|jgi:hypothetical protein|uniref:Uncharacterized protein n=1 Tax=Pediococcus inopinatus TaxID=114090 RepID=A0ABZ0Q5U6_9LACO|nr:hypothetical protein [Pediococcus inopinatus]AVK99221.1 hypothetical protein PI20285_00345 [Pediococcus inopinatus]KRN61319.1 hypothetical protein IV83_GL000944 [Pediococcus inopinatus]WPC16607.1 hypothetical protein N6G94_05240 [Pediococcus inopinatus]WPC20258.1 hypothetical protein N6G95_03485 [Pediococcus inopinatus]WPC21963.1 hypothetical protein N6G96_01745 [Pediococcus inopinatus]